MGGDHKCLVCGSTFTRPQHVARHMRSHTGDRPYKCSHCGDQFARSDLLSRHVNKCHASEKPPTTTQPARRKGHAQPGSSSAGGVRGPPPSLAAPPGDAGIAFGRRICDACAVSRTPAQCDAGLPCGKCFQRNTKCTYIKSTDVARRSVSLPSIPPIPSSISGPSSISFPGQHPGDQQHAPQQQHPLGLSHDLFTTPTVPSMAGPRTGADLVHYASIAADPDAAVDAGAAMSMNAGAMMGVDTALFVPQQQQSFNFTVPLYPQALDLRAGDSVPSQSTHITAFTDHTRPHNVPYVDTPSKGLDAFLAGYNAAPVTASDFLYDTGVDMMGVRQQQEDEHGAQDQRHHPGRQQQQQQQPNNVHPHNFHPTGAFQFGAHQQPQHSQSHSQSRVGEEYTFSALGGTHAPQFAQGTLQHPRPVDGILRESRGATTNTNDAHDPTATAVPITTAATTSLLAPPEGGVWNAFGLMSLDDPIVAAEMSKGGSFFAPGALPGGGDDMGALGMGLGMDVGVPGVGTGAGGTMTPGRDANIAELRDFWKAFMRTPGEKTPGAGGMVNGDAGQQAEVGGGGGGQRSGVESRPTGLRRSLSKMTSLPEIKTPPTHAYGGAQAQAQAQGMYDGLGVAGQVPTDGAGVGGAFGREDLRSYEMAVMARQAPTRLTLPRKRATFPRDKGAVSDGQGQGHQQQPRHLSPRVSSSSTSSSPLLSGSAAVAVGVGSTTSGASPSASVISAGSAGEGVGGEGGSRAGSVPSVRSVSGGGGGGADGSGGEESGGSAGHSPMMLRREQTHPIPHGHGREGAVTGNANVNVHSRPHDVRHRMHANAHMHVRQRPSFKRLASQTLGPFESKSVKVSHGSGSGNGVGDVKVELELLEDALGLEGERGNERTRIGKGEGEGGKRSSGRNAEESDTRDKADDHANSASYLHADATTHSNRMPNATAPGASEGSHRDQQGMYHHHPLRRSREEDAYREAMERARRGHGHEPSYAQGQTYMPGLRHGSGDEFYHHQHQQHRRLSAPSQSATRPAFGGGV